MTSANDYFVGCYDYPNKYRRYEDDGGNISASLSTGTSSARSSLDTTTTTATHPLIEEGQGQTSSGTIIDDEVESIADMEDIPPFSQTAAGSVRATKGNNFLVPQCLRYLQSYLDKGGYIMDTPHLVAYTSTRSCTTQDLGKFDTSYVRVVVKTIVQASKTRLAIYIVDFGAGRAHGAGVSSICDLFGRWRQTNHLMAQFEFISDGIDEWTNPDNQDERVSRAPDLCIAEGNPFRRRGIVELEVKNRSVELMRRDYAQYFYGEVILLFAINWE